MENRILMPIATALWLKKYTKLSIDQIAQFCNLSTLEVISLEERKIVPFDPTTVTITLDEIRKYEDNGEPLKAMYYKNESKGRKYVSKFEKQKLGGVIAWFVANDVKFDTKKLAKIFSTTSKHIENVRNNLSGKEQLHPVRSGLLSNQELQEITQ